VTPDELGIAAGGGAIATVGIILAKAILAFAQDRAPPKKPDMISVKDHEQLMAIHGEIENSKEDRAKMLKILCTLAGMLKDLYQWHDQRDEDGALKWLNKRSLEREIHRIGKVVDEMNKRHSRAAKGKDS